jgi:hypothetical protein
LVSHVSSPGIFPAAGFAGLIILSAAHSCRFTRLAQGLTGETFVAATAFAIATPLTA